jgi:hypothetical protein
VLCYGRRPMLKRHLALVLALAFLVAGCSSVRQILGLPSPGDPSVTLRSSEPRWLLVKNPRYGDVPSEPEYMWVEEDKVPWTVKRLVRGQKSMFAPPEIVAQYGPPPGGGKISPKQGVPYQVGGEPRATAVTAPGEAKSAAAPKPGAAGGASATATAGAPAQAPKRGYVVWLDTTRIVVDLTGEDGLRPGSLVSLRRDKIPIVHPITGELLGELDEEVATARIVETRDKFSVGEIQSVTPGSQVQLRDRVVPK